MVRITNLGPSIQMVRYYIKRQSLEAYYSDNQEFNGYWGGKAAKMLGLEGHITELEFSRLSQNLHPKTGEKLTARMNPNRRSGFDITFDCPKSVSILYARTLDDRIVWAMRQAVADISREIEESIATRVRAGLDKSADGDRTTGNFVTAEIVHLTARPENGFPDPHLHLHLVVFNCTRDEEENKWKAIQMGHVHEEIPYFQAAFHLLLAENLRSLGLDIVPTKDAFEIAGIPRDLIDKFSRRTTKINATAKRLGITDPAQKAKLGALTRERKGKKLLLSELTPFWWNNLSPKHEEALRAAETLLKQSLAIELSEQLAPKPENPGKSSQSLGEMDMLPTPKKETPASSEFLGSRKVTIEGVAKCRVSMNRKTRPVEAVKMGVEATEDDRRAVSLAIEHVFERASVVTEKHLIAEASKNWCIHRTTLSGIKQAVAEARLLHSKWQGQSVVTTAEVWAEEQRIVNRSLNGKGRYEAMNPNWKIKDKTLTDEQRNAVMRPLRSMDFMNGIKGGAGVGKTKLLKELRDGIQSGMHKVLALAPTSEAARDVLRKEGFENADTVAKLLRSEQLQEEARGAVWVVDEAGLLSTREADGLIDLALKLDARLVFVADPEQHHAVIRGQAFDLLQKRGGMEVVKVTKIQRQKGMHKHFVEQVIAGDIPAAMNTLKKLEWAFEMNLEERKIALANEYVFAIEQGDTALVVAPTHAECADVTRGIRAALKERKMLKRGTEWDILRNLSWTNAQKRDYEQYEPGQVVQINDRVDNFGLREQVEVIGAHNGMVLVGGKNGYIRELPIATPEVFSVYERDKMEICEGDCLRITANGYTADKHRLNNKSTHKVDYISNDGTIVLEDGVKIDKDFKHLDYGYVVTSYGAQGKTVDWVFVAASAELSSSAIDMRQFYVSMSRGRKGSKLYGDDLELVEEYASRRRERPMAMEVLEPEQPKTRPAEAVKEDVEDKELKVSAKLGMLDDVDVKPEMERVMRMTMGM